MCPFLGGRTNRRSPKVSPKRGARGYYTAGGLDEQAHDQQGIEGGASGVTVEAQFNPKEISIDKSVPWQKQKTRGPGDLEFSSADPQTMSSEPMFDGEETQGRPTALACRRRVGVTRCQPSR